MDNPTADAMKLEATGCEYWATGVPNIDLTSLKTRAGGAELEL